jgi:hypothetical protein
MKVTITPELVERAVQKDSRHCMIAEAIKLQNPHFKSILVDLATIRWTNPRTRKRYVCLTPEVAGEALVRFDQGQDIEPFAFTLTPIQATPTKASGEPRGRKKAVMHSGQLSITGGHPLRTGHLGGGSDVYKANEAAKRHEKKNDPDEPAVVEGDESNVRRSSPRYRQYGRRILQG